MKKHTLILEILFRTIRQLNNDDFLDSAFFYFRIANDINQYYVQAIHNIGLCYEIKKDFEMAKSYYKKAIEIDNNYTPLSGCFKFFILINKFY